MKTFKILGVFVIIATLSSFTCLSQNRSYTIKVTGKEHFPKGSRICIYQIKTVESSDPVEFLKTAPFKNGFALKGIVKEIHLVILDVLPAKDNHPYRRVTFVLEPGTTKINFTSRNNFVLKGGKYNDLIVNSWNNDPKYKEAMKNYIAFNLKNEGKPFKQYKEAFFKLLKKVNAIKKASLKRVALNQKDPLVKLLLYNSVYRDKTTGITENAIEEIARKMGKHREALIALMSIKNNRQSKLARKTVGIGAVIKDFKAQDLAGKTFHLANVLKKNKYVLVDFWASWCGPCRAEIPHLKKAYNHFKNKGFEIVSFSLDNKHKAWKKATEEEGGLPWINTSDLLAYTSSIVKMYGISGIPANFLVEAHSGKIIAKNLRQDKLDKKLAELLK